MEIIEAPKLIINAASEYTNEALETIAKIMRHSESEKMRLLAAMALLDRATIPKGVQAIRPEAPPPLESRADMRSRLVVHMKKNAGKRFDERELKSALELRSPATAIRSTLVQLQREGVLAIDADGRFMAKSA